MSTPAIDAVLDRLRNHAREDDVFAEALAFLARTRLEGDPFHEPRDEVLAEARHVNAARLDQVRRALTDDAFTTSQVVELLASARDRRAVYRHRARGEFLGVRVGRTIYHPTWQFDLSARTPRRGLREVLAALTEVISDPMAADALMTTPRAELDGRTPAEVFADGSVDRAVAVIRLAADQS